MAKHDWIGNYKLHYVEYYSYKDVWVAREANLGYCVTKDEAFQKAVDFIVRENITVDYEKTYISDGFGNKFFALGR
jgi:hypothetical protein